MNWWTRYWFRPGPLLDLSLLRIAAVGYQVWWLLYASLNYWHYLSGLPDEMFYPIPALRAFLLPFGADFRPPFELLAGVYWATLVAGLLALVGLRTNIALAVFAAGCVFLHAYTFSFGEMHHVEAVMMLTLAALALSPCGRVLSVDAWMRQRSGRTAGEPTGLLDQTSVYASWPILFVQWMFVLMYLSASISKLLYGGVEWMNGFTLQYYLIRDGIIWDNAAALWFARQHDFLVLAQWCVILFQSTFALAVLFPVLRWVYIPLGLSFHLIIYLTLSAPFFTWIILYIVFVPWTTIFRRFARPGPVASPVGSVN